MRRSALIILLLSGCGSESGYTGSATVVDSAGIAIVTAHRAEWRPETQWRLEESPDLSIGGVKGEQEYIFDRIMGAVSFADGTIAVADMGSSQVRLYDSAGTHVRSIGGAGSGPGEFRQITALFRVSENLLAVHDRVELLNLFRRDGTHLQSHRTGYMPPLDPVTYQLSPTTVPMIVGWLNDSTYVTIESTPVTLSPTREFREPETVDVVVKRGRIDGGEPTEILRTTGPTYHPHASNLILPAVFGPSVYVVANGSEVIVASSGTGEVRWFSPEGHLSRISRLPWPAERVTSSMIEEYIRNSVPPLREELARGRTFDEVLPAFSALMTDAFGQIWLRRFDAIHASTLAQWVPTYDRPSTWAILAADGRWLGDVELPAHFSPLEIGVDYVIGIHRDENDVETVRRYRIRKPDAPQLEEELRIGASHGTGPDVLAPVTARTTTPEPDPELRDDESFLFLPAATLWMPRAFPRVCMPSSSASCPTSRRPWIDTGKRGPNDGRVGLMGSEITFNRYFYRNSPPARSKRSRPTDRERHPADAGRGPVSAVR